MYSSNKAFLFSILMITAMIAVFSGCKDEEETITPPMEEPDDGIVTGDKASLFPPNAVSDTFAEDAEPENSDNFDADTLDESKWTFRTMGGARWLSESEVNWRHGANIRYGLEDEGSEGKYISIKASSSGDDKGSDAITSKFRTRYGFYIAKFRGKGMETNVRPIHHPAIWGAWKNFSELEPRSINGGVNPDNWMEVDFIEMYDNAPAWKMLTLTHDKDPAGGWLRNKNFAMSESDLTKTATEWQTIGFEFRPEYIRFWRCVDEVWEAMPKTISVVDGGTNTNVTNPSTPEAEVAKANADLDLYWIISNVHFRPLADRDSNADVFFEIDHFLFYPFTQ